VGGTAHLIGFGPDGSFARVGQVSSPTFPTPLTVQISQAVLTPTIVAVSVDAPNTDAVVANVTIPAGSTSAPVLVTGVAQDANVPLTATLGSTTLHSNVRVLGAAEVPSGVTLSPATANVFPGGTQTLTVTLDIPAPAGGTSVALSLAPPNAGTIPVSVVVPQDQISATFDYVDGDMVSMATVTATLGSSMSQATLTITSQVSGLVINEVDYDQPGTDSAEFVEIFNGSGAPINLTGFTLYLVNGSTNTTYTAVDLGPAGTIAPLQYLVVGTAGVTVQGGALSVLLTPATNAIQNGAPDGVALVDTNNNKLVDSLSYEGSITAATITGLGTVNLVNGNPTPVADDNNTPNAGALCRFPDGARTGDDATDWHLCKTPTPGVANSEN
jgi:hypothetical protein